MFMPLVQWKKLSRKLFVKRLRLRRMTLLGIIKERILEIQREVTVDLRRSHLKNLRKTNLQVVEPRKSKTLLMTIGITRKMKKRDH